MTTTEKPMPVPVAPPKSATAGPRHRSSDWAERYGLLVLFAAVVIYFGFIGSNGSTFLSHANLLQIAGNQMIIILVAFAAMLPLNAGYFDLSAGATAGISSVACASAMSRYHANPLVAVVAALIVGVIVGAINGILVARFKLSAVITTLAMSTALTGIMQWYTAGSTISNNVSTSLVNFGSLTLLGIPRLAYVVVPVIALMWYVAECTPFGRNQRAIRSSDKAARLVGIGVDRTVLISFLASGLVAGLAGALLVARSAGADSTTGPSYLFPALAAVFLGATTIKPGRPNVIGTVVGVFFVAVSVSGLTLAGASAWVSDLFNGLVLFAAAGLSTVFSRQRGGSRMF